MAGMIDDLALPERPRILVVDDDEAIGGTIKRYLRQYDITLADCVLGALDEIARDSFDLVLLDRRLPDGLGDFVVEQVRRRPSSLPIIMMSGEVNPQRLDDPPQYRADDFIEKPFVREALIAKIERQLTAHAMRRQTVRQQSELAAMHERIAQEIDAARTILGRIFARGQFDPDTIRHVVLPADRLSGDVVLGAWAGDGRYRWMIGDVTGHTLASALVTVPVAGVFYRVTREAKPLAKVLAAMERELVAILPSHMFCVGAMCELDRRTGVLQVWNGGNPDILIRHGDGRFTRIPSTGLPLAVDRFSPPVHPIVEHAVAPGDRIFAFSDGLVEHRLGLDDPLGLDRLLEIAQSGAAQTVFDRLVACIPDATGKVSHDDDISLIEVIV